MRRVGVQHANVRDELRQALHEFRLEGAHVRDVFPETRLCDPGSLADAKLQTLFDLAK